MRRRLPALVAAALIAGCASLRPVPTAQIPVAHACVRADQIPARPALLADAAWASPDPFERARALLVDRLRLLLHAERLEALLKACAE